MYPQGLLLLKFIQLKGGCKLDMEVPPGILFLSKTARSSPACSGISVSCQCFIFSAAAGSRAHGFTVTIKKASLYMMNFWVRLLFALG